MLRNKSLIDVDASQPVDTVVHLGAGNCSELDAHLALQPRQMLLVEADLQLAEALRRHTADLPQVQVVCAAVAGSPGPAVLYRYNLPDASSLHPAQGLLQLFPGLKLLESLQLESVSPSALLQPMQLQEGQENILLIDLPGEELPALQALQQAQQLHLFRRIQLYCGREPLYESSEPAALILHWLQEQGFDLLAEDSSQDPDRPCWTLQLNPLQLRNRDLQAQQDTLQSTLAQVARTSDEQAKSAAELREQLEQITETRDEQTRIAAELKLQLEQAVQAKDVAAKLAAERQQQMAQLATAREEQAKLAADRQTQLEQANKAKDEQAKLASDRQQKVEQLTKAQDEQAKIAAELKLQLEQAVQAKDVAAKLAADRQQQMAQLTTARDEQAKLAADRQAQLEQANKAKTEVQTLAAERQKALDLLKASCDQLEKDLLSTKGELAVSERKNIEQSRMVGEYKYQAGQLEQENNSLAQRQQLLDEELIKAEAQIELIKDILIREKAF